MNGWTLYVIILGGAVSALLMALAIGVKWWYDHRLSVLLREMEKDIQGDITEALSSDPKFDALVTGVSNAHALRAARKQGYRDGIHINRRGR